MFEYFTRKRIKYFGWQFNESTKVIIVFPFFPMHVLNFRYDIENELKGILEAVLKLITVISTDNKLSLYIVYKLFKFDHFIRKRGEFWLAV